MRRLLAFLASRWRKPVPVPPVLVPPVIVPPYVAPAVIIDGAAQIAAWGPQTGAQIDAEQRLTVERVTQDAGPLGVARTYAYCYGDDQNEGFGIVRKDESPRPSWTALQSAMTPSV